MKKKTSIHPYRSMRPSFKGHGRCYTRTKLAFFLKRKKNWKRLYKKEARLS